MVFALMVGVCAYMLLYAASRGLVCRMTAFIGSEYEMP